MTFLAPQHLSANSANPSANSTGSFAITTFKAKAKDLVKKEKAAKVELSSSTSNKAKSAGKKDLALNSENNKNSNITDFSYKNIIEVRSNPNDFSKNEDVKGLEGAFRTGNSFGAGMFYGFAIMVVLLNLVCFFLFDEKLFLFYALTLTTISGLLFFSDGLSPMLGFDDFSNPQAIESFMVLATCFFGAWFASKYLIVDEIFPRMKWITAALFGSSAILTIICFLSSIPNFGIAANLISYGVISLYFMSGVYLFSKKNYPKFYVIALSIPLLFAIDYFVLRNLGLEFLMTQPSHLKAAVVAEMLMLTYAIVYRMKAIKEENELRQTELRIFLKRQEVINRKNAMQLMEEVYLENLIMHYDLDGFEIKLLQYISEGKDNTKIARKLKTTESEIEALTKELYNKLEISEQIREDYRMVDAQADYIYN
jgi:DNA-binding CsgD family transcriptional regulator